MKTNQIRREKNSWRGSRGEERGVILELTLTVELTLRDPLTHASLARYLHVGMRLQSETGSTVLLEGEGVGEGQPMQFILHTSPQDCINARLISIDLSSDKWNVKEEKNQRKEKGREGGEGDGHASW